MVQAYSALAKQGYAHSIEIWINDKLVAGLYCVSLGQAVFGESMFTTVPNGSKIALAALVHFCALHGVTLIDCQQQTPHLALMGAQPIARTKFTEHLAVAINQLNLPWQNASNDWITLSHKTP